MYFDHQGKITGDNGKKEEISAENNFYSLSFLLNSVIITVVTTTLNISR